MSRMRIVLVAIAGLTLFTALAVAGSKHVGSGGSPSAQGAVKDIPVQGGTEELGTADSYWNTRLTYPTGHYNPAWLRIAARQAARLPDRAPAGGSWTPLGPQPERWTAARIVTTITRPRAA